MATATQASKKAAGNGAAAGPKAAHSQASIFEQMMENSPLNFIRADTDLIIRYMNPASRATLTKVAHLLPIKVDDMIGACIDIFHKNPAYQRRILADPKNLPHRADIRLGPETLNLIVSAVYDDAKNYIGALVAWEIVTERVRLAADNSGQLAAIGKSQAVIEFQMDGTVVAANDNFLKALGYTLDEIKGKHHSIFVDEAYRQSNDYREFWAKLNRGEYQAGEYKRIGKGGREVWIQASYNPILDADNKPFKVVEIRHRHHATGRRAGGNGAHFRHGGKFAYQYHLCRSEPENPIHEPGVEQDAADSGTILAGQSRADCRPVDRYLS